MAEGKFSHPRPHREEDRQIEEAFRQVTGQPAPPPPPPTPPVPPQKKLSDFLDLSQLLSEEKDEPLEEEAPATETVFTPDPPAQAEWMDKVMDFFQENRRQVLVGLCAAAAVLVIAIIAAVFSGNKDPYGGKILSGVTLGDVNVGGMTKSQAVNALKEAAKSYESTDMTVSVGETLLRLTPADTKAKLDAKAAVNAAYAYGRTGTEQDQKNAYEASRTETHTIGLLPYLKLDTDYIRSNLDAFAQKTGSTLTQTTYTLEGVQPTLSADQFDPHAPGQTLVITMGSPGTGFDASAVYDQVLDAYSLRSFTVTVEVLEGEAEPDPIDLDAIYKEIYVAPVDASIDRKTYEPIPGSYGCEFDLELAKSQVANAEYGQQIRIPLTYIAPEVTEENVLYRDVLGEYRTQHTSSSNRNTNLRLACEAINGTVLDPGDTFSFNDCLGERTSAKGYKEAPAYSGDDLVDSIGGGICQVSSTLYCAALVSDLEIVSRTAHGFPSSYIPYGLDAAVSWRSLDLKFRNSTGFPIRLEAELADGYVNIRIMGTDERDYYVKLEYKITATQDPEIKYVDYKEDNAEGYKDGDVIEEGVTGYTVKSYRVKYSNTTGKLVSRDFEATTQYKATKTYVARVKAAPTTAPTTLPTTAPTTAPTTPTTAPPTTAATTEPTVPSTAATTEPPAETEAPTTQPTAAPPETSPATQSGDDGSQPETP